MSSKRPRIVTCPDAEKALFLWVKHMEEKRETINGLMLVAKRADFEKAFNVPEDERLPSEGLDCFVLQVRQDQFLGNPITQMPTCSSTSASVHVEATGPTVHFENPQLGELREIPTMDELFFGFNVSIC